MSEAVKAMSPIAVASFIARGISATEANRLCTGQLRYLCLRASLASRDKLLVMDRYKLAELAFEHYGRKSTR